MRDLQKMFRPKSVAVIGASRDEGSVGYGVLKSLLNGGFFETVHCQPFPGKVFAINPKADEILGVRCFPSISVVGKVDLVVFCIPAKIVIPVMEECIRIGIKNAVVISSGFAEFGEEGKKLQAQLKELTEGKVNVVGPNCLGIIDTFSHLNASFAPTMPPKGDVGFITQSGALADSIIDWAVEEKYGFSKIISFGNGMDLDVADYIEFLGRDPATSAIGLYLEGVGDGRKFMKIARKVSKKKPIIAIKAGKTKSGQVAVSSHTGSLAGGYEIFEAACGQSGIIVAKTVEELFDFAHVLSWQPSCENGIAIVTNGGGAGVLTADACESLGVSLSVFDEALLKSLDASGKMHPAYSRRNPLDIVGDALPERYEVALDLVLSAKNVHGLIVIQTLQTMTDSVEDAKIVARMRHKYPKKPIVCMYMGGKFSNTGINYLKEHRIPDVNDPSKAASSMKVLIERYRFLRG